MRGRPAFQPTDEQRKNVQVMVGLGITEENICLLVRDRRDKPISRNSLRKHFKKELETGATKLNAQVGNFMVSTISPVLSSWSTVGSRSTAPEGTVSASAIFDQASYGCPTTFFLIPATDTDSTSAQHFWTGGPAVVTMRSRSLGRRVSECWYEPHPSCGDCPVTARSRPKRAAKYPEESLPDNRS
jgi:hypothetical protein